MSSVNIITCGRVKRSAEELVRSLSCHSTMFSNVGGTKPRTMRLSPQTFSETMGLRFWAMVELPTCLLVSKGSATSAISERCRLRTSVAYLSHEVQMMAIRHTSSAYRSRHTTWVAASS